MLSSWFNCLVVIGIGSIHITQWENCCLMSASKVFWKVWKISLMLSIEMKEIQMIFFNQLYMQLGFFLTREILSTFSIWTEYSRYHQQGSRGCSILFNQGLQIKWGEGWKRELPLIYTTLVIRGAHDDNSGPVLLYSLPSIWFSVLAAWK